MKTEFLAVFQITKMIIFEVKYYTLGDNPSPYFTTSAARFIKSKRDYSTFGQCQAHVLPKNSKAYKFYKKWDCKHLHDLTEEKYTEMITDLKELMTIYNYIYDDDLTISDYHKSSIPFYQIQKLSKMTLK